MIAFLLYAVVAAGVVFASIKASQYVDMIDRTTKLSGAFLGGVLLSAVTSLPELFTSLSATVFLDKPGLCISNILGSDLFNLAILSVMMLLTARSAGRYRFARGNIMVALYMALIYGFMLVDYAGFRVHLGTINLLTPIFAVIYILAVRHLSGEESEPDADEGSSVTLPLKSIVLRFVAASAAIIGLSIFITYITDYISVRYSICEGLAGALFLGVATSLPEVSSTIALFRMKNYDIAVGNIVGSNLFNIMVLCIADVVGWRQSVYVYDDPHMEGLLLFGAVAAAATLPMLGIRNRALRIACAVVIMGCYAAFLARG